MRIHLLALAAALAAAGCTGGDAPDDATTTPTPTPSATPTPEPDPTATASPTPTPTGTLPPPDARPDLTLTTTGVPTAAIVGVPITFDLNVTGDAVESDHVGAHYDVEAHPEPTRAYGTACVHVAASLPSNFTVSCTFESLGTHYLRGHVRVMVGETSYDSWAATEHVIQVRGPVGPFNLTTSGVPFLPVARNASFNFTLSVEGPVDASNHIGGHFGPNSTDTPTVSAYPFPCNHTEGPLPGDYLVTCTIPAEAAPGQHHLRGHVRITVGAQQHDFWADEDTVLVI